MRKRPLWMWLDEAADLHAGTQTHHLAERILEAGTVLEQIALREKQFARLIAETRGFATALAAGQVIG